MKIEEPINNGTIHQADVIQFAAVALGALVGHAGTGIAGPISERETKKACNMAYLAGTTMAHLIASEGERDE